MTFTSYSRQMVPERSKMLSMVMVDENKDYKTVLNRAVFLVRTGLSMIQFRTMQKLGELSLDAAESSEASGEEEKRRKRGEEE